MGSRRGRYAALIALVLAGCTSGAPPGFAGARGDRWTFPLIGPIEGGLLLVPVSIDGKGPYVFAIDPDANISAIDEQLVVEGELRGVQGPKLLDETDTSQIRFYAEVPNLEIGNLIVQRQSSMIVRRGTFDREGRRIMGLLGRDVLADSLVFGFDRDHGIAELVIAKSWKAPPGAVRIPFELVPGNLPNIPVQPVPRRLATATIGGQSFAMHLDLGAQLSSLRTSLWDKATLTTEVVRTGMIDEVGVPHLIEKVGKGASVTLGPVTNTAVLFAPYEDRRWRDVDVDGTLGLDFFRDHDVWLHWDDKALYVVKRTPQPVATRIGRWESGALGKCPHEGCVSVKLIDPMAGKELAPGAKHPGFVLSVTRDEPAGGMDLEVTLEPVGRPELPRLVVNLTPNGDRVMDHLKAEWAGVTFQVVDASPFPRACKSATGCIDHVAR